MLISRLIRPIRFLALLLLAFLLILAACSDDGTEPQTQQDPITGLVLDDEGNPVADAGILLTYPLPLKRRPETDIDFQLPDSTHVKCWVMSECWEDTIRVFWDQVLPPGDHVVFWDGRDSDGLLVSSGLYNYYVQSGEDLGTKPVLLLHDYYPADADPTEYRFQAVTGPDGAFVVEQDCLPFGYEDSGLDETGEVLFTYTIPREVRIHAMHPDFLVAASDWVTVDAEDGCHVNLQFTEGPVP